MRSHHGIGLVRALVSSSVTVSWNLEGWQRWQSPHGYLLRGASAGVTISQSRPNSYPVRARRTPQSRIPAQAQETQLRILAGIGDRMVEEGAGYRDRFPFDPRVRGTQAMTFKKHISRECDWTRERETLYSRNFCYGKSGRNNPMPFP